MYQILCDGSVLHDNRIADRGYIVGNPKCKLKTNTTGTLTFVMYPNHPYYNNVKKLKSVIDLYQDGEWLFSGRVLNDDTDFDNIKTITVEGELSYLLDSNQRLAEYHDIGVADYFTALINKHNAMVDESKQFTVGDVTVTDPNDTLYHYSNWENTWNTIKDKLIDKLGGYIRTRHDNGTKYIDYIADYNHTSSQIIDFGENLLNLKQYIKGENIATAVIPLGAKIDDTNTSVDNRLTIASVNNGVDYLYSAEAVDKYGWIFAVVTHDDVTNAANLKTKGQQDLNSKTQLSFTIELNAIDLHLLNVEIERFKLGDMVRVISAPHGIDKFMQISEMDIDIANPENTTITLGDTFTSLTDTTNNKNSLQGTIKQIVSSYGFQSEISDTKKDVNNINISLINLSTKVDSDYMTAVEVQNTYATKTALNELVSQINALTSKLSKITFADNKYTIAADTTFANGLKTIGTDGSTVIDVVTELESKGGN
jgi:hypothetical protein